MASCEEKAQASAKKKSLIGQGGAAGGAAIGSFFGPIGTGVGGIVGGLAGLFGGKAKKCPTPPDPSPLVNSAIADYQDQLSAMIDSLTGRAQELEDAKRQLAAANARAAATEATRRQALLGAMALGVVALIVIVKTR